MAKTLRLELFLCYLFTSIRFVNGYNVYINFEKTDKSLIKPERDQIKVTEGNIKKFHDLDQYDDIDESDEEEDHKDFDPVIDFPDNDPNYKEKEKFNTTSIGEESHQQLHTITNTLIHQMDKAAQKIDDIQESVREGTMRYDKYLAEKKRKKKENLKKLKEQNDTQRGKNQTERI